MLKNSTLNIYNFMLKILKVNTNNLLLRPA
jgi:hypothetical protein